MSTDQAGFDRIRALITDEPAPVGRTGGPDRLSRLCRAAARSLSAWGVGLSVMAADGTHGAVASSSELCGRVEELQFTLGEGPCLDAVASGRPILTADLATALARWPGYGPSALDLGVRAVFAFPLQMGAVRLGALDVYCDRPGPLNRVALQDAVVYAEIAVLTLLDAQAKAAEGEIADVLDAGLDARVELFQAQGMVMIQLGVGLAEAMVRLRAFAYLHDRPLLDVAQAIVARRLTLNRDPDPSWVADDQKPAAEPDPEDGDTGYTGDTGDTGERE